MEGIYIYYIEDDGTSLCIQNQESTSSIRSEWIGNNLETPEVAIFRMSVANSANSVNVNKWHSRIMRKLIHGTTMVFEISNTNIPIF